MKKILLWMIRFYRKYLSGLKGYSTCKYYPTCSSTDSRQSRSTVL